MTNLGFDRPRGSRGVLPLIAASIIAGGVRAGIGAISANQTKQRNKGFINANYRVAKQRLDREQGTARQGIAESLNARGLAQGGDVSASPIHAAMVQDSHKEKRTVAVPTGVPGGMRSREIEVNVNDGDPQMRASGPNATTLGGQEVRDANEEMGLEQFDLEQQRDQALAGNKSDYNNALLGAGVSGVQTGIGVYGAGKDFQAMQTAKAADRSKIHAMMLSGSAYDGVHPNDPLGEPTSAWSTQPRSPKLASPGQENASFNAFG